jgi:hypothetical protein
VDDAPGALTSSGVSTPDMPWLGALAATATKTTQLVSVHQLLADDLRARLFTET